MNNIQLFISEHLKLTPIDVEKDAPMEAGLTLNLDYVRHLQPDMRRPLSVFEVKAYYTELLKELKKGQNQYHFVIRRRDDRKSGLQDSSASAGLSGQMRMLSCK